MPTAAERTAEYWNAHVGDHLSDPNHWEVNAAVREFQGALPGSDVPNVERSTNFLERFLLKYGPFHNMASICCGSGLLERHVAGTLGKGARITGFDISESSLASAREQAQSMPGVSYEVSDANTFVWSNRHFDAVFAHGSLHHVTELEHCLDQVAANLAPGGLFYVNDYVGPARFQWPDEIIARANALLSQLPSEFVSRPEASRCDPDALAAMDPVRSGASGLHSALYPRALRDLGGGAARWDVARPHIRVGLREARGLVRCQCAGGNFRHVRGRGGPDRKWENSVIPRRGDLSAVGR